MFLFWQLHSIRGEAGEIILKKELISKATHVFYDAKIGILKEDTEKIGNFDQLRPKKLCAEFPDLYLTEHGNATFVRGDKPVILINGVVAPESSIGYYYTKKIDPIYLKSLEDDASRYKTESIFLSCDVFVAYNEGSMTWGHWFGQILPTVIEFLKFYPDGKVIVPDVYFSNLYYKKFSELAVMAGIDNNSFVRAKHGEIFEIENLITCDFLYSNGVFHPKSIENLDIFTIKNIKKYRNTFMQRLHSEKNRNIINCLEIENINHKNLISEFSSGHSDLLTQQTVWAESSICIGVLGSDFTNMLFGTSGRVLMLTPNWFGDNFFYGLAAALGYEWNELFCNTLIEKRNPIHRSSFHINPDVYRNMIEIIL